MTFDSWVLFALAITVASISPGPNVMVVVINTLKYGLSGAVFTVIGNIACLFCIALLAAVGVGAVLATTPVAFFVMKIVGGMYLAWMGFNMIRGSFAKPAELQINAKSNLRTEIAPPRIIGQAFMVTASNPKAILFLSAVFPQFLNASEPIAPQFTIMFATIIGLVCVVHGLYAIFAARLRTRQISVKVRQWMLRITGTTFIGLGVGVVFSK